MNEVTINPEAFEALLKLAMASADSDRPERADSDEAPYFPGQIFWDGEALGCFDADHNVLYAPLSFYCCDSSGTTHAVTFAETTIDKALRLVQSVRVAINTHTQVTR